MADDPARSRRFKVEIDHHNLGAWTKCEGLSVEYEIQEYKEGGENTFVHRLPGRAKYQNIKLTRPLTAAPEKVADWLTSFQPSIQKRSRPGPRTSPPLNPRGRRRGRGTRNRANPAKCSGPGLARPGGR